MLYFILIFCLQTILKQTKYFVCKCSRCLDPSEHGAMLAGLKCQNCKVGYMLPRNPEAMDSEYACEKCDEGIDSFQVRLPSCCLEIFRLDTMA